MEDAEKLMTVKDVSVLLQIEEKTVYSYCKRKGNPLPFIKISPTTYRFDRAEILAWLKYCQGPFAFEPDPALSMVRPQPRQR